jgi:predicted nucleotide-binding protein
MQEQDQEKRKRTVYVVYEKSTNPKINQIQEFLRENGLTVFHKENIIEMAWDAVPFVGGELIAPTPFVGDVLTITFDYVQAVIVLLTGEEEVQLCTELHRGEEEEFEKTFCLQPTQEQIFEAGYAFGTQPMRTIVMQIGDVRPFSDIAGRHILHFTGIGQDYNFLRASLRLAGCMMGTDSEASNAPEVPRVSPNPQKVFVVHGRDFAAKSAMFAFLRSLDLTPIEWDKAVRSANKGSSAYTGEAAVAGIDEAQAVVVLLTGDDLVQLEKPGAVGQSSSRRQARPNVLFEAGITFSRCGERTILVQLGNVRPCHDMEGRSMIKLTNKSTSRWRLIQRLIDAGCPVQLDGRWDSSGNFQARPCS